MSISSLSVNVSGRFGYTVNGAPIGANFNGVPASGSPNKSFIFALGSTPPLEAADVYAGIISVAASGSQTINLQSFTDVLGVAAQTFGHVVGFYFQLLSTTDDSVNGTLCTGVTIGNAGSNPTPLIYSAGATFTLGNGDFTVWGTSNNGVALSGTAKNVLITNNDSVHAAAVAVGVIGY